MTPRFRNTPSGAPEVNAAPAGGPTWWGRGCVSAFLISASSLAAATEPVEVPSGLGVAYHDMIWDEPGEGLTYRFRFLAPGIGHEGADFMSVIDDMEFLCNDFAIPRLASTGPVPSRIVITLMAEPVEFGVMTPGITQFFESYSIENDLCIWEAF